MSKLAAIGPFLAAAGITPAVAAGIGLTAAGTLGTTLAQRETARKQEKSNNQWLAFQNEQANRFEAMEDEDRGEARDALFENLKNETVDARNEVLGDEKERLTNEFEGRSTQTTDDIINSSVGTGESKVFDDALAKGIAGATADARKRMSALAGLSSYGGSSGGLRMDSAIRTDDTNRTLGQINNERMRQVSALEKYQQIEPEMFRFQSSGLGEGMKFAGDLLIGGFGSGATQVPDALGQMGPALPNTPPVPRPTSFGNPYLKL